MKTHWPSMLRGMGAYVAVEGVAYNGTHQAVVGASIYVAGWLLAWVQDKKSAHR